MNVLIVAKTHMSKMACVGALAADGRNVRLLRADGANQPSDTPYEVGEIWDLAFRPAPRVTPPHIEDVWVSVGRKTGAQADMRGHLMSHVEPWRGDPRELFGGLLRFNEYGVGHIERGGVPGASVGFWIPTRDLWCEKRDDGKVRYSFMGGGKSATLPYVGFAEPAEIIPAGSLLRVSLCRWWQPKDKPEVEEACYLQLSGWY